MRSSQVSIISILIVLFYLAISDCFGLLDFSLIIPGELYDYIAVLTVCTAFLVMLKKSKSIVIRKPPYFVYWPFCAVSIIGIVQAFRLHASGQQSLAESFSVIREILFILLSFAFVAFNFDSNKIIRTIIRLDVISVLVYIIEMLHGGPVFSAALHTSGLYESLGGMRVWRCWVDLPTFELFTTPYLLISITRNKKIFRSRKNDLLALGFILLGIVLKLGRGELIAVIASMAVAYLYVDRPSIGRKIQILVKIFIIFFAFSVIIFFLAPGIFQRLLDGLLAVIFQRQNSTVSVRTNTLLIRWNYLVDNKKLIWGLGPYSYKSKLIIDPYDTYGTNSGVFSPDSAYATFLVRYGIFGTAIYIYGFIKNHLVFLKRNSRISLSIAAFMIGSLIAGFSGYDMLGKQTLLKVAILIGLSANERLSTNENNDL